MKVIFLDVDGVLNCKESWEHGPKIWKKLDKDKLERLKMLVQETGAVVVLSSTWRLHDDSLEYLKKRGVKYLDCTPAGLYRNRGGEIDKWISMHPEAKSYVILDDDSDMLPCQESHFIQTSFDSGLQDSHVKKAISILGRATKHKAIRRKTNGSR